MVVVVVSVGVFTTVPEHDDSDDYASGPCEWAEHETSVPTSLAGMLSVSLGVSVWLSMLLAWTSPRTYSPI